MKIVSVLSGPTKLEDEIKVETGKKIAFFNAKGLLRRVSLDGLEQPLQIEFVSYRARKHRETSGAYLFLPSGEAEVVDTENPG